MFEMLAKDAVTIERSPNEPATLTCELRRDAISVEEGDTITCVIDGGHQAFYGKVFKATHKVGWSSVTAYDQIFNITKKIWRWAYENQTASQVLKSAITHARLNTVEDEHIMDTGYVIPYRIEQGNSWQDIIVNALNLTFENTGKKFYIWDNFGSICLHSEEFLADQPYIQITPAFVEEYDLDVDATELYNAVHLVSKIKEDNKSKDEVIHEEIRPGVYPDEGEETDPEEPDTGEGEEEDSDREEYEKFTDEIKKSYYAHTAQNEQSIEVWNFLQYNEEVEEGENGDFKAEQKLKELNQSKRTLSLKGVQGDITVMGGTPLLVDFFTRDRMEFIRGWYCTDQVTHRIEKGTHTMDLTLSLIQEIGDWENDNPDYTFHRPEPDILKEEEDE